MAEVTVERLAEDLGVSTDLLLSQLNSAGIHLTAKDDTVTAEQKQELLSHLKRSHGMEEKNHLKKLS